MYDRSRLQKRGLMVVTVFLAFLYIRPGVDMFRWRGVPHPTAGFQTLRHENCNFCGVKRCEILRWDVICSLDSVVKYNPSLITCNIQLCMLHAIKICNLYPLYLTPKTVPHIRKDGIDACIRQSSLSFLLFSTIFSPPSMIISVPANKVWLVVMLIDCLLIRRWLCYWSAIITQLFHWCVLVWCYCTYLLVRVHSVTEDIEFPFHN